MAHLVVTLPELPPDQKYQVIKNLTETVGSILNLPYQAISVLLHPYHPDDVGRGGKQLTMTGGIFVHADVYTSLLTYSQRQNLAFHITRALGDSLGLPIEVREYIFVTFHQFSAEHWANGGRLAEQLAQA